MAVIDSTANCDDGHTRKWLRSTAFDSLMSLGFLIPQNAAKEIWLELLADIPAIQTLSERF
jgi:hypothetical protein